MRDLHVGQLVMLWVIGGLAAWFLGAFAKNLASPEISDWVFWPVFVVGIGVGRNSPQDRG